MARNSLQDQLLKSGVANRKQAVRARKAKDTREKMQRKGQTVVDETAAAIEAADTAKRERDRALNQQQQAEADARAVQAQIDQLVSLNKIDAAGDVDYAFDDAGVIRTLMVDGKARGAIIGGALSIVRYRDGHALIPVKVARKISERDRTRLVVHAAGHADSSSESTDIEDEYAGYVVPDDLLW